MAIVLWGLGIMAGVGALLWWGLRLPTNEDPAIGNNSPWPTSISSSDPPYTPGPFAEQPSEPDVARELRRTAKQKHNTRRQGEL